MVVEGVEGGVNGLELVARRVGVEEREVEALPFVDVVGSDAEEVVVGDSIEEGVRASRSR